MKNKISKSIIVLMLGVFASLTGCITTASLEDNDIALIKLKSNERGVYFFDSKKIKYCAEPSPDTAITKDIKLFDGVDINLKKLDVSVQLNALIDITSNLNILTNRTQKDSLAREHLYRLCELSSQDKISKDDTAKIFMKIINDISSSERARARDITEDIKTKQDEIKEKVNNSITPAINKSFPDEASPNFDFLFNLDQAQSNLLSPEIIDSINEFRELESQKQDIFNIFE